jgi:hypothetical protein
MRDKIFISYSHQDRGWMEEFMRMMTPLVRLGKIHVWCDSDIDTGDQWRKEIDRALSETRVAVLAVSDHYMHSAFIHRVELPRLLQAAQQYGVSICWCLLSSCLYEETPIEAYQAAHDINRSFDKMRPAERKEVLKKVALSIKALYDAGSSLYAEPGLIGPSGSETTQYSKAKSAVLTPVDLSYIELTIDRDFDQFSPSDQERLLKGIAELLKISDSDIRIRNKRRGSVILEVELTPLLAQRLLRAVRAGELDHLGVTGAELADKSSNLGSESEEYFPQDFVSGKLSADAVPALIARLFLLSAEDQLALIWHAYMEAGKSLRIAPPSAALMKFAEATLNQIKQMSFKEQSQVIVDLANRADTDICRTYGFWSVNIKFGFWYVLGKWMEEGDVAPIPARDQLSVNAASVLNSFKSMDSGQQIIILRNFVADMGYAPYKAKASQRVTEQIVLPTAPKLRTRVTIQGINYPTILSYMDLLNANDFDNLIELFLPDGALQPPFQRPIVGKDALLRFFHEDCQNLKLRPERGVSEPSDGGFTAIIVIGKVQTPWFAAGVWIDIAWRFLLNPDGKIYTLAIDLLASPAELRKFDR